MMDRYFSEIVKALNDLPPTDPLTFNLPETTTADFDSPARNAIDTVLKSAPQDISSRLRLEYFGAGPIEELLNDPEVTEILINSQDSIWFEKKGVLTRATDRFYSSLTLRNFVARLSREAGIVANLDCPFADGHWRGCRVHLIVPPASGLEPVITLRQHARSPWNLQRLETEGWATSQAFDALKDLVARKENFLVVGGTGSGKTSVLNACLATLPPSERAVIIEDTSELTAPNAASTKLVTRRDPQGHLREIDLTELVRHALRMRPDRIIMGEIRGGEAKDLLMAFATGHAGCMGTLHADSARQALLRLEMLVQLGAPQWTAQAVRSLIHFSLKAIVVVGRHASGARRLEGIYRIASLEDVGFLIEKTV